MNEIRRRYLFHYIILLLGYVVGVTLTYVFLYLDWVVAFVILWTMLSMLIIVSIEKDVKEYKQKG